MQTKQTNKELKQKLVKDIQTLKKNIEQISEEDFKKYLDVFSQFHKYSFHNNLLIHSQKKEASQVASFKKWKEQGRNVKKGEKSIRILAPAFYKKGESKSNLEAKSTQEDQQSESKEENQSSVAYFITVPVFDISQTEGKEIEKNFTEELNISLEEGQKIVKSLLPSINIKKEPLILNTGGYYSSENNLIALNSNLSEKENVGTLFHELSHALLHHGESKDVQTKDTKEQEAETLTYLFCKKFNIKRKSHFYLKSWNGIAENLEKIFKTYQTAVKKIEETS